ncbi:S8 family serine peptidase [Candidatus Berkelbacteria bacterium]|nr:S8 family serine peptidase [Candidatus Berkelbacteria bacterium]
MIQYVWERLRTRGQVVLRFSLIGGGILLFTILLGINVTPPKDADQLGKESAHQDAIARDLNELNGTQTLSEGQLVINKEAGEGSVGHEVSKTLSFDNGTIVELKTSKDEEFSIVQAKPDITTFASTGGTSSTVTPTPPQGETPKIDPELVAGFEAGSKQESVIVELKEVEPPEPGDNANEGKRKKDQLDQAEANLDRTLGRSGEVKAELDLQIASAVAATVDKNGLAKLAADPSVKRIEPDREVKAFLDTSLDEIKAKDVWPSFDRNNQTLTGVGKRIAIIDTGVDYRHPDLGGCLGANCKVIGGYDFVNNDADPLDDHGHGTHVAATAAGKGTLNGVAPDATILAYKVLNQYGSGSWSAVIAAIGRATDPNNDGNTADHVDVANMSLGGSGNPDDAISRAVDNSSAAGVVHAIAAGNSGSSPSTIGSPGTARTAITAAAACKAAQIGVYGYCATPIASFSSRGPLVWNGEDIQKPDLAAPGVYICAAYIAAGGCAAGNYSRLSGTSMATPHVAGAAALARQAYPDYTPAQIKQLLKSTARNLGSGLTYNDQGAGEIDLKAAIPPNIQLSLSPLSWQLASDPSAKLSTSVQTFSVTPKVPDITALAVSHNLAQPGITLTFDNTNLLVPGQATATFKATLIVDNDLVKSGSYQATIVLAQAGVTKGIIPINLTVKPTIAFGSTAEINYGVDNPSLTTWTSPTKSLTVTNLRSDVAQTITASAVGFVGTVALKTNPTPIIVAAGAQASVDTSLEVANSGLANGTYRGTIKLESASASALVPASFTKFYVLEIKDPGSAIVGGTVWIHDRQATQYSTYMSASSTTRYLNSAGPYDIVAFYPQVFDSDGRHMYTVFKEGVGLATTGQASVTINRSDAKNEVKLVPSDADGNRVSKLIDMNYGIVYLPRPSLTSYGALVGSSDFSPDVTKQYYSDVSANYRVVHQFINPPYTSAAKVHLYYDGFNGLTASQTTANNAADFKSIRHELSVNRAEGSIAPQLTTCLMSLPCLSNYPYLPASLPLSQTFYSLTPPTLPSPNDTRYYLNSDANRTGCIYGETCHFAFITPWFDIVNQKRRLYDPLPAITDSTVWSGLGPVFPALKFLNSSSGINLYPYAYGPKAAFLRQDYSIGEYDAITYQIVNQQGSLIFQGTLPRLSLPNGVTPSSPYGPFFNLAPTSGGLEFKIDSFGYRVHNQLMKAKLSAKFNLASTDPNPPAIKRLYFYTNGKRSELYEPGVANRLEFEFDPIGGSIAQAKASYASDGVSFTPLPLQGSAGTYAVDLPDFPTATKLSIQIQGSDGAGNSLSYTFELPANLDVIKPTAKFSGLLAGSYLSKLATIIAEASDDRGISKVELYRSNFLIGSKTEPPFEIAWETRNISDGSYALQLKAYDISGNTATADLAVNVDNTPPTIYQISQPSDAVTKGVSELITSYYDRSPILKLEYAIDGGYHGQATSFPWIVSWDTRSLANGSTHSIVAIVHDAAGNVSTSSAKRVTVYDSLPIVPPPSAPAPAPAPAPSAPTRSAPQASESRPSEPAPAQPSQEQRGGSPAQTIASAPEAAPQLPSSPPRQLRPLNKKEQRQKAPLERQLKSADVFYFVPGRL